MKFDQKESNVLDAFSAFVVEAEKVKGGYTIWGAGRVNVLGETLQSWSDYDDCDGSLIGSGEVNYGKDPAGNAYLR